MSSLIDSLGIDRLSHAERLQLLEELLDRIDADRQAQPLTDAQRQELDHRLAMLEADPTVLYGNDSQQLAKMPLPSWTSYVFWAPIHQPLNTVTLPDALIGYQTYTHKGLMPGPICTPTVASVDAALHPDTKTGYLFFVAKGDGSNTHAFAKTYKEHQANLVKYGYR